MKKLTKKLIAVLLTIVMVLPIAGLTVNKSQASVNYNRTAALNYAKAHWNDGVGQCAQFVSACLTAGGLSVSQNVCLNLWNTLKNYGTPYKLTATSSGNGNIKLSSNTGKVEAGDPLFYVCDTCGGVNSNKAFPHVVFCGGTDSQGRLTAYGHNAAWNNKLVWTQFSSGAHAGHKTNIYSIHINAASSYTITYNANGGSGAPSPQTYSSNSDYVTISSVVPYRTGYTFNGWLLSPNPGTVNLVYEPGTTVFSMGDETLYAYWKANEYTINYNANGGSGSMSSSTHTYDTYKSLNYNSFTRSGYTFLGWSTSSSATSATYSDGQSVVNLTSTNGATITLYAVWRYNPPTSYTLSYNANGGSGAPSSQTGATGYYVSSTVPTRIGLTFLGWSTNSSATSATYKPYDYISLSSNTTLYAVWADRTPVHEGCSYNAEISFPKQTRFYLSMPGSSGTYIFESTGSVDSYIKIYNKNGTVIATDDDSGESNNFKLSVDLSDQTYYHVEIGAYGNNIGTIPFTVTKKAAETYTLSYNANGGSGAPSSQSGSTTYTISSTRPTRSGYTFLGWSKSSSATSASYVAGNSITLSSNTTLYAVWRYNAPTTYTLYYNANGGSGAPSSQSGSTTYTISSTRPTRSGYTFLGWSKSSSATSASYVAGNSITLSSNTTLYAVWRRNTSSNDNIKITIRNNPSTVDLNYGDTIRLYADATNLPTGARIGWYVNDGSTISAKVSDDNTYCDITATGSGTVTIAAKAVDANGNVITDSQGNQIGDVQKINTKSSFWLRIVSFFKNLFGANRTTVQAVKNVF